MDKKEKISVQGLFKIFGDKPETALKKLKKGSSKEEVLAETGMTVGVQDANFTIYEGEIFVVMGLSGSGKSTLVRMLNRLIEPTSGSIFLDGKDIAVMGKDELKAVRRKKISMVFQSFALMPHLSVIENAAFGLEMTGLKKIEREALALAALEQVGLDQWAFSMPDELSGGMKQRVGLARALAVNPDVLLMDEAFSALDPLIRAEMQDELLKLQKKLRRTIVFISHDLDEAMRIGDRIAIMEGGRVVQVGTPEDILQNPADDYVKAFFRGVDPTVILTAKDIAVKNQVTIKIRPGNGPRTALQRLIKHERDFIYVIDENETYKGVLSRDELIEMADNGEKEIHENHLKASAFAFSSDSMQDVLPLLIDNPFPIPVTDSDGTYVGTISKNIFLKTLHKGGQA
ncbi:glycine betaine/L-proline ABC transporter ATP-binding protein ProV [Seleniivibrio sp.]|uniref:glycine betaine/L-proline ABC transporter ATP-binding protein ProV n=1 Tax=Seleniivibrio sp. TaxID=2898801 RepID=UPI0025D3C9F6|nr:glycine betaine/L-proline ABC transporter ATP-binding protein ProV [Seleniivibrio sp.]MCD8554385.1 glycine betaine/L-proline ABC transporter ATP-binding protein ProV [Seleniivibrio sp.]